MDMLNCEVGTGIYGSMLMGQQKRAIEMKIFRLMKEIRDSTIYRLLTYINAEYSTIIPSRQIRWLVHKVLRRGVKLGVVYEKRGLYRLAAFL